MTIGESPAPTVPAFHLAVDGEGIATLTFDLPGKAVNVFTRPVLAELAELVAGLGDRSDVRCLVLVSGKAGTFIAGADVDELARVADPAEAEVGSRRGQRLFASWAALPFPTVAGIRGTCLGGGTELALASTLIAASDGRQVRIGLPEVRLGILPGWGGCTRLPRRIGLAAALDLILTGKSVDGRRAFRIGLADALLPDAAFLAHLRELAAATARAPRARAGGGLARRSRSRGWTAALVEDNPLGRKLVIGQARKRTLAQTGGHYPAPLCAIDVVRAGIERGEAAGFEAEARAIAELAVTPVAKHLIHVFRLMEGAKKDAFSSGEVLAVRQAAVVGAGRMGGGIAQLVADTAGVPVRLKDLAPEPLAGGLSHAAGLWERQVRRRRLSRPEARRKLALLRPTLDDSGLARVDLVIEAVVEKLAVKQGVFADLAGLVQESTILASNTSSLSIDAIGDHTPHPERVVGMHFFNPVHKMPLVEVVLGRRTSPTAARTVAAFARRLGKTPVLVHDGPGFLVNRLLMFYSTEALWLIDEGHTIEDVDRAMTDWGMPMGPITLADEVGLDVAFKVASLLAEAFADRLMLPSWTDRLIASGRLGAKSGKGFLRYRDGRRAGVDPAVYELLGREPQIRSPSLTRLAERMVLPMVNEAARCLEEEIVGSAGELDLAMIMGTGFPPFRGGLCRWADEQGLPSLIEELERLARQTGERFRPSEALRRTAADGGFYGS